MNQTAWKSKFFKAEPAAEGVTRITGMAGENCYLVEGEKNALLIDGLTGVGSLKAFVRELTELSVIVALTHGHLDHTGAAWEYGEVYIMPDDIELMYSDAHSSREERLKFAKLFTKFGIKLRTEPTLADVPPSCAVKTCPLREGDCFDLGGRKIEVIAAAGHTKGTAVFLDREHRILFAGDACNSNTLLNLPESVSIKTYLNSLRHLKEFQTYFDVILSGHDPREVPASIIDDGISLCEKILSKTDAAVPVDDPFGGKSYSAAARDEKGTFTYGGLCNILYKNQDR